MIRSVLKFALVSTIIAVSACEKSPQQSKRAVAEAGVVLPEDKSASKPPGCATLAVMNHFDGLQRLDKDLDGPVEEEIEKLITKVTGNATSSINRAKRHLNDCDIHIVHLTNIQNDAFSETGGKKQVIFNILVDTPKLDPKIYDVGLKFTCWADQPEKWRITGDCPADQPQH